MVTQTIIDLRMFSPAERFVVLFKAHILRMTITKLHIDDFGDGEQKKVNYVAQNHQYVRIFPFYGLSSWLFGSEFSSHPSEHNKFQRGLHYFRWKTRVPPPAGIFETSRGEVCGESGTNITAGRAFFRAREKSGIAKPLVDLSQVRAAQGLRLRCIDHTT